MVQVVQRYLLHICFHLVVGMAKSVVDIPVSGDMFLIRIALEAPVQCIELELSAFLDVPRPAR